MKEIFFITLGTYIIGAIFGVVSTYCEYSECYAKRTMLKEILNSTSMYLFTGCFIFGTWSIVMESCKLW